MYQVDEEYVDKVARFINSGDPHYGRKEFEIKKEVLPDSRKSYQESLNRSAKRLANQVDKDIMESMMSDGMTESIINPHMNDGGSAHYYELPKNATELAHLIHHKRMSHPVGEAFCSLYRMDDCPHSDRKRNIKKVMKYMEIELENMKRGVM